MPDDGDDGPDDGQAERSEPGRAVTVAHIVAGTIGAALLRGWYLDGAENDRLVELVTQALGDPALGRPMTPAADDLLDGYARWAPAYDSPNPMIATEERIVHPIVDAVAGPGVRALDAACGTGRHAAHLAAAGCDTFGIDQSEAMLDVARAKVPTATFTVGSLTALPYDDREFDLAVVSLALCHLADPTPALVELARVLRVGGTLVVADPHTTSLVVGGQAFYRGDDGGLRWVRNHYHHASTWLAAFRAAGLEVLDCIEPPYSDDHLAGNPTYEIEPGIVRAVVAGLPSLWVWHLRA